MIEFLTERALAAFLTTLRLAPVVVLAPPFSLTQAPLRVRVCLVMALAACFALSAPAAAVSLNDDASLLAAVSELVLGLVVAFSFQMAFAGLSFAGRVLDVQAGYGLAMVIDPGSRGQAPLFGTMLTLVAGLVFFACNGHIQLLRLLMALFEVMPVGHAHLVGHPQAFMAYVGVVMGLGLIAVGAVVVTLFLIDLTIAFLSRALPQMNALMLGLQIKTLATLTVMALSTGLLAPAVLRLMSAALAFVPSLD